MSKEIYEETEFVGWISWGYVLIFIAYIIGVLITQLAWEVFIFSFIIMVVGLITVLYQNWMRISIDEKHIIIERLFGIVKKKLNLGDILSYSVIDCSFFHACSHRSFVVADLKKGRWTIKGKVLKLKTQKRNYLIGTQNPEKIMEILKVQIGDKKELQNP